MTENARTASDVSLEDVLNQEVKATGADIPDASYGATLCGFTKPFMMAVSEKFRKPGQPDKRLVFEAEFAISVKGEVTGIRYLVPVPDGGMTNRKSNMYKLLRALGAGTPLVTDEGFKAGTKIADFIGKTCTIGTEKNAKDWPQVKSIAARMDGAKYVDLAAGQAWFKSNSGSSESLPF